MENLIGEKFGQGELSIKYAKEDGTLAEYMDYLNDEAGLRKSTAYNYYLSLRHLAKFLEHERNCLPCMIDEVELPSELTDSIFLSITQSEYYNYLDYCSFQMKERKGSLATRISVLRGFFIWLFTTKHGGETPSFIISTSRPAEVTPTKTIPVTESMIKKIYKLLADTQDESLAARNICVIHLVVEYGLTVNDILNLELSDINTDSIRVRTGAKPRVIPLTEETTDIINRYLSGRHQPNTLSNPFFVSEQRKGRLRACSVQKMLRKASVRALDGQMVTFRDLRSTAMNKMLSRQTPHTVYTTSNIGSPYYFAKIAGTTKKEIT